tara:strand:- start:2628 stop:3773 length:1146 start_codon:yes stop_codon:yes gene_type:complete
MGFFSKVWKGVKKTFKKIGKGIKKGFQKFGKFMGKIGVLGQIAMSFILPGIGSLMLKGLGSMMGLGSQISSLGGLFANMAGSSNAFIQMAGKGLKFGYKALGDVTRPFTSVIDAVTNLGKTTVNKVGNIFGFTPFKSAPLTYGDAFSSISDDFTNMYSKDRWQALDATTSNRETLNELQKMSDEELAKRGFTKDSLDGATAVADGFIEANRPKLSKDPYGTVSEYEYTEIDVDKNLGSIRGADSEVYTEPTSLLSPSGEETFKDRAVDYVRGIPGQTLETVAEIPGQVVGSVATTAAHQKLGLAPTVDDMYPDQPRAKQGFGYINFNPTQYAALAQTQDIDPYELMAVAYQSGNREAQNFINGANYGGWSSRLSSFSPRVA